jgi:hypothetical protein
MSPMCGASQLGLRRSLAYLEFGCGQEFGAHTVCNPTWRIFGVNFNPVHIAAARTLAAEAGIGNARFIEADLAMLAADVGSSAGDLLIPAIELHEPKLGRTPHLVAADAACDSRHNEAPAKKARRQTRLHLQPRHEKRRAQTRAEKSAGSTAARNAVPDTRGHQRHQTATASPRSRYKGADGMRRWVGLGVVADNLLVLVRQKSGILATCRIDVWQQGHLGRLLARTTIRRRRKVAIEFGMCRSGRIGGASGSATLGNGRSREPRGGGCS